MIGVNSVGLADALSSNATRRGHAVAVGEPHLEGVLESVDATTERSDNGTVLNGTV